MKRTICTCDRCGREITEKNLYMIAVMNGPRECCDYDALDMEFCETCIIEVTRYAAAKIRPLASGEAIKAPCREAAAEGTISADVIIPGTLIDATEAAAGGEKSATRKKIDVERAVKLRREGKAIADIAEEFGVSIQTVRDRIARYEKTTGEKVYPNRAEIIDMGKVNALRKSGWTQRAIAEEFRVHESVISRHIKNWEAANGPLDLTKPAEKPLEKWCKGEGDGVMTQTNSLFCASVVPERCI